jgi:anti-sigma factor ChrR (cupin superfamily)
MTRRREPTLPEDALPRDAVDTLADAIAPVAPAALRAAHLRARILARARATLRPPPDAGAVVSARATEGEWKPLLPGVHLRVLHADPERGVQSYLLRLEPGASIPRHGHAHDEECVVLEGEVRVGERRFGRGDWHLVPRGVDHEPIRSEHGALVFLRGDII